MIRILRASVLSTVCILGISGCQHFIPKAQGLASAAWIAQDYERQDQVEVQWKEHSFSFLLYQQQKGQNIEFLALTLTGQQLFKLNFDGQKVQVEQRVDQMKLLPFDFLVRDILFATYPNFAQLQQSNVEVLSSNESKSLKPTQTISIQQQKVLIIRYLQDHIELDNVQVPYQMIFSEVPNTLENNE